MWLIQRRKKKKKKKKKKLVEVKSLCVSCVLCLRSWVLVFAFVCASAFAFAARLTGTCGL